MLLLILHSGGGALAYNSSTGAFTYTPPDLSFSNISSTPTTIAGYGITDAFDGAFSSLSGKPTTISGYGITDAFDGIFASLTAKPTTIAGYGITDAFGAFSSLTVNQLLYLATVLLMLLMVHLVV